MPGLYGILSIANDSLQAQQAGLEVTSNNIANVNTPGYTRQVALLAELAPFGPNASLGGGVELQQIQSVRDSVLDIRINQETQIQSQLSSLTQQLNPVQTLFSTSGGAGLGTAIDSFFSSLQQLSTNPTSGAQRQSVITAAQTMAQTFQQVSAGIGQQQTGADQEVLQAVGQVNTLLGQIASLNNQIAQAINSNQNDSALVDQRTSEINNLAGLVDFNVSDGGDGQVTLTTSQGSPLVVGAIASPLTTAATGSGVHDVFSGGNDITASLTGGSLAGLIQARDVTLPGLSQQLDALASSISSSVNAQNALGFTPTGSAGGNLFTPPPATGAAGLISLATTDPNAIAASSDGTAGSNGNVLKLADLQTQGIVAGQTPDNAYAAIVSTIGSAIAGANTQQQASQLVLTQLHNQRDSTSGVSMDEESINLNNFQSAYQAATKLVTVVNQLTNLAINLGQD